MLKTYFFLVVLMPSVIATGQSISHDVVSAGGGNVRTDVIQVDWTLGELAVEAYADGHRMVTEGFQQPWLIVEDIADIPDLKDVDVSVTSRPLVYPNPTTGWLTIRFPSSQPEDVPFRIYLMDGSLIGQFTVPALQTEHHLDLSGLPAGIYLLKTVPGGQEPPAVFRVTKSN